MAGLSTFVPEWIACQVVAWQRDHWILTEPPLVSEPPSNQCCFLMFSLGRADLITQRCCILDCSVKHIMLSDSELWYFLCFCAHSIDCPLYNLQSGAQMRLWNTREKNKTILNIFPHKTSILYCFSISGYILFSAHTKSIIVLKIFHSHYNSQL